MFFNNRWVELTVNSDSLKFSQVISKLEDAGIAYEVKSQTIGPQDRRSGNLGGSSRYNTLFQVYVKKKDLEQARCAIRCV